MGKYPSGDKLQVPRPHFLTPTDVTVFKHTPPPPHTYKLHTLTVSEISINQAAERIPLDGLTRVYTATGFDPESQVAEEHELDVDATKFLRRKARRERTSGWAHISLSISLLQVVISHYLF